MTSPVPVHDTFLFSGTDGTAVTAYRWRPDDRPRGIVQITHGMGEHLMRYAPLAVELALRGYLVQGHDARGHGATAGDDRSQLGVLGEKGWAGMVDDVDVLLRHGRDLHPDVPVVLLGHSMGSFVVQEYVTGRPDRVDAVVLSGTGALDMLESAVDLDRPMDMTAFNTPFEGRTGFEWLTRDPTQVDLYVADDRCGAGLDVAGVNAMFAAGRRLADPATLARLRDDTPLYLTVGDADPLNVGLTVVTPLVERYQAAGLTDVTLRVWPGARHDVFKETNRDEIVADLLSWVDRVCGAPGERN